MADSSPGRVKDPECCFDASPVGCCPWVAKRKRPFCRRWSEVDEPGGQSFCRSMFERGFPELSSAHRLRFLPETARVSAAWRLRTAVEFPERTLFGHCSCEPETGKP